MKVLKSVNFRTKCKKKVEHKPTSKKKKKKKKKKKNPKIPGIYAGTWNEKVGKWFNYY